MERIKRAVFDAGPLIHLQQVGGLDTLRLFSRIIISEQVVIELRSGFTLPKNSSSLALNSRSKDLTQLICDRYNLGLGEATAIALAKQEGIRLFFTDDLGARDAANLFGLEPHGTLAIITRSFREKVISKHEAISLIEKLQSNSSLYLISDLVNWARKRIESYRD